MVCPNCATNSNSKYCPDCGAAMAEPKCSVCGAACNSKFCPECGAKVAALAEAAENEGPVLVLEPQPEQHIVHTAEIVETTAQYTQLPPEPAPAPKAPPAPTIVIQNNVSTAAVATQQQAAPAPAPQRYTPVNNSAYSYPVNTGQRYISRKSRMLALLLCAFIGVAGIHRFYVGKVATGLLYLFTGGLFGIGWLIDMILIATGSFKDSYGFSLESWS